MSDEPPPPRIAHDNQPGFGRRAPSLPPIVMHAPDGLRDGAPSPRPKRSEWVSIGAFGATLLGVMTATETVFGFYSCPPNPPQQTANTIAPVTTTSAPNIAPANSTSTSCHSSNFSHYTHIFHTSSTSHTSSSAAPHFGGFGLTGSFHVGSLGYEARPSFPRADFADEAERIGFHFATIDGKVYWDESVRYEFSMAEIEAIEAATEELAGLCLELVGRIVTSEVMLMQLQIPRHAWDLISESWHRRDASLYGRLDFVYDGMRPPQLLEYNADTPTSLLEAGVVQWFWLEQLIARGDLATGSDQFNSLHEKLIARWRTIANGSFLHLACQTESIEDRSTIEYLAECANQAGLRSTVIGIGDIGLKGQGFVDRTGRTIDYLFKLYPWEWMLADQFGKSWAIRKTRFVEPAWKMILSNKGMLAPLWDLAPNHPNLLPSYFERDPRSQALGDRYARKPLYSREGNNIELVNGTRIVAGPTDGYGAEGFVRQQLRMLPDFSGNYPVIGSWIVGEEAAGMGIREDTSPITSNTARFIPHVITLG